MWVVWLLRHHFSTWQEAEAVRPSDCGLFSKVMVVHVGGFVAAPSPALCVITFNMTG